GSRYSYFGHDDWRRFATEVKSLESALETRGRILSAFEAAEMEPEPDRRASWLTFVVVGAGPTGVEMAGQIGELARDTLSLDFKSIDLDMVRVLIVELDERVLPSFPPKLSQRAANALESLRATPLPVRAVVRLAP